MQHDVTPSQKIPMQTAFTAPQYSYTGGDWPADVVRTVSLYFDTSINNTPRCFVYTDAGEGNEAVVAEDESGEMEYFPSDTVILSQPRVPAALATMMARYADWAHAHRDANGDDPSDHRHGPAIMHAGPRTTGASAYLFEAGDDLGWFTVVCLGDETIRFFELLLVYEDWPSHNHECSLI
jgi:hypothetical protein